MIQVHDQVWIADIGSVRENSTEDFDRVITTCQDHVADNVGCAYEWYNMSDGEADGYGGDSSYNMFETAADSLLWAIERGERVLVHCHMGQSRSVSVALSAIAVYEEMSYDEAFNYMKERRPVMQPDSQLRRYSRRFIGDRQ